MLEYYLGGAVICFTIIFGNFIVFIINNIPFLVYQ